MLVCDAGHGRRGCLLGSGDRGRGGGRGSGRRDGLPGKDVSGDGRAGDGRSGKGESSSLLPNKSRNKQRGYLRMHRGR